MTRRPILDRAAEARRDAFILLVLLILLTLAIGCAHFKATTIPVCSRAENVVCRAPSRAQTALDGAWEDDNVCPEKTDPSGRACYLRAGVVDGRQLYVYIAFDKSGILRP